MQFVLRHDLKYCVARENSFLIMGQVIVSHLRELAGFVPYFSDIVLHRIIYLCITCVPLQGWAFPQKTALSETYQYPNMLN